MPLDGFSTSILQEIDRMREKLFPGWSDFTYNPEQERFTVTHSSGKQIEFSEEELRRESATREQFVQLLQSKFGLGDSPKGE